MADLNQFLAKGARIKSIQYVQISFLNNSPGMNYSTISSVVPANTILMPLNKGSRGDNHKFDLASPTRIELNPSGGTSSFSYGDDYAAAVIEFEKLKSKQTYDRYANSTVVGTTLYASLATSVDTNKALIIPSTIGSYSSSKVTNVELRSSAPQVVITLEYGAGLYGESGQVIEF